MYLRNQRADNERYRRDKSSKLQPLRVAQRADRTLLMFGLVFPREPTVNAHPAKIHLQEHIGVEVYLVKDDQEKYGVRDAGGPCKDIRPRREEHRDQPKYGADKLNVANRVFENCKECLFNINEHCERRKIGHSASVSTGRFPVE